MPEPGKVIFMSHFILHCLQVIHNITFHKFTSDYIIFHNKTLHHDTSHHDTSHHITLHYIS